MNCLVAVFNLASFNIVLIDALDLAFGRGLGVLTGETGAGKSILLDALGFVLGWRGRAELVRAGAAQGEVTAVFDLAPGHPARAVLDEAGIEVTETDKGLKVKRRTDEIKAINITTEPFPGFPTDLQAQMMAVLCTANGTSVLEEKIFENRFMHVQEMTRMGADIRLEQNCAIISGKEGNNESR